MRKRMRTLSICNLKGGVAKTTTAVTLTGILASEPYNFNVLLVDNDQQGNASQFFQVFDPDADGTAEVICMERNIRDVIKTVDNNPLVHVLPANMNLAAANRELMTASGGLPREIRLREALSEVADEYDFYIIDNGPNMDFTFDNAMIAADDFIVPVKIDKYSFYGIKFIMQRIEALQWWRQSKPLNFIGCLVTMQHNRNKLETEGAKWLEHGSDSTGQHSYKMMDTKIKYSHRVNDTTFSSEIITVKSVRSLAADNYKSLAAEYLSKIENL